jgi:uncharacterized protein with HEPN domain
MTDTERDGLYLRLIAEAIDDIQRRIALIDLQRFLADRDEQALTAFRLSIIGENANKLSVQLKQRHPDLAWYRMVAFRNIVAHEYHRAEPTLVWEAALALGAIEDMASSELARSKE